MRLCWLFSQKSSDFLIAQRPHVGPQSPSCPGSMLPLITFPRFHETLVYKNIYSTTPSWLSALCGPSRPCLHSRLLTEQHSVWLCSRFSVVSLGGLYSLPRLQTTTLWTTPKCTSLVLPLLSNLSSFSAQLRYHTGASDFACAQENLTRPLNSSPNPHFLTCPCSFIPYLCLDHEDLSNQPSFKPQNHLWFSLPLLPHME